MICHNFLNILGVSKSITLKHTEIIPQMCRRWLTMDWMAQGVVDFLRTRSWYYVFW
jgi:hypothetical protein